MGEVNREIEVPQIEYIDSWSRSVGFRENEFRVECRGLGEHK